MGCSQYRHGELSGIHDQTRAGTTSETPARTRWNAEQLPPEPRPGPRLRRRPHPFTIRGDEPLAKAPQTPAPPSPTAPCTGETATPATVSPPRAPRSTPVVRRLYSPPSPSSFWGERVRMIIGGRGLSDTESSEENTPRLNDTTAAAPA